MGVFLTLIHTGVTVAHCDGDEGEVAGEANIAPTPEPPREEGDLWEGLEPLPEASYLPQEEERPPAGPPLDPEDRGQPSSSVDPTIQSSRDREAGERGEASPPLWETRRETSPTTGPLWEGNAPVIVEGHAPVIVEVTSSPEETPSTGPLVEGNAPVIVQGHAPVIVEVPSSPEEGDAPVIVEVPASPEEGGAPSSSSNQLTLSPRTKSNFSMFDAKIERIKRNIEDIPTDEFLENLWKKRRFH